MGVISAKITNTIQYAKDAGVDFKKIPTPPSGKRIKNVEVVIKLEDIN